MKIFGITGYIGSGKSTVCRELARFGAQVIDADEIVHELYQKDKDGARKIELFFGDDYLKKDGSVNRRKLRKVVFGDSRKLKILNNLIHPLVSSEIEKRLRALDSGICVIEAISFERKCLGRFIDGLIWVERKLKHGDSDILNLQEKPKKVDFTIDNNCSRAELKNRIKILWQKFTSL